MRPFELDVGSKLRGQGAVWPHEEALEAKNEHKMPFQGSGYARVTLKTAVERPQVAEVGPGRGG